MEIFQNIELGLSTALSFNNLLFCFIGVLLGTAIGVLPGVSAKSRFTGMKPRTKAAAM